MNIKNKLNQVYAGFLITAIFASPNFVYAEENNKDVLDYLNRWGSLISNMREESDKADYRPIENIFIRKNEKLLFKKNYEINKFTRLQKKEAAILQNQVFDQMHRPYKILGLMPLDFAYDDASKFISNNQFAMYDNGFVYAENNTIKRGPEKYSPLLVHEVVHHVQSIGKSKTAFIQKFLVQNTDINLTNDAIVEGEAQYYSLRLKHPEKYDFSYRPSEKDFNAHLNILKSDIFDVRRLFLKIHDLDFTKENLKEDFLMHRARLQKITFPYTAGALFFENLKNIKGKNYVNRIVERKPISTEQILHIEKYLNNEQYIEIDEGFNPYKNTHKLLNQDVFGEFGIGQIVTAYLPEKVRYDEQSFNVFAGWNGDAYWIYPSNEIEGHFEMAILIHWDSKKDAQEFFSFSTKYLKSIFKNISFECSTTFLSTISDDLEEPEEYISSGC